jgi:hypothetical protein
MVFYPTVTEIIEANKIALAMTKDKHPHKLRGSAQGIQSLIDDVKKSEDKGLTYQAARFMKEVVQKHPLMVRTIELAIWSPCYFLPVMERGSKMNSQRKLISS